MNGVEPRAMPVTVRVVLAPDVVGGLWLDASCAAVFASWRDEQLVAVVNRDLLVRYVRLWRALGLPSEQIRRWSLWFTSASRACFLDSAECLNAVDCCSRLAVQGGARWVLHRGMIVPPEGGVPWLPVARFRELAR